MAGRTVYYTATSLDGYIAGPGNSMDWLLPRSHDEDGFLGYGPFLAGVGAMAMGATTYEWVLDYGLAELDPVEQRWPYEIPCWVFTHRSPRVLPDAAVELTSDDVRAVHARMAATAGEQDVWIVGGGDLAGQFADAGLLDEVLVNIAPVVLGAGAPLLPRRLELRLEETGRNGDFLGARLSVVRQSV